MNNNTKAFGVLYALSKNKKIGKFIEFMGYFYLFLWNKFFCKVPSYFFRYYVAKYFYGLKIGKSNIHSNVQFLSPWNIWIEDNVNIQMHSFLDGRGGIKIGNNVDITIGVKILSQEHDIQSPTYDTRWASVNIGDHVVVGSFSLLLPGLKIEEGAVIGAGSVVRKDVGAYEMHAGNPAKFIKNRNIQEIRYKLNYKRYFH